MHVTIEINGRQALPVRAIPLLTDWRGLSPDQLAQILAGDSDHWPSFDGLTAYSLRPDGSTEPIPPRWWASWVVRKLQATSDAIKAKQASHETGYQQWRSESLAQLPAGVFVWRDEFEAAHADEYGPEGMRARGNPNGFDPSAHAVNFNPHPDPDVAPPRLVLEGFGPNADAGNKNLNQALEWLKAPREVEAGQDLSEHEAAWFDATLDAAGFFALEHVTPVVAAMLLCRLNPHDTTESDAERYATDCTSPEDFKRLRLTFASIDQNRPSLRSLLEWMDIAAGAGRTVHPWAHRYAKHHGLYGPPRPESEPAPTPAQLVVSVNMVSTTVNRLSPPASPPESVTEPAPQAETPAPVVDSARDAFLEGITTAQVAAIFDALHYTAENWPKRLSDTKWLKPAQVALGAAGGATSLWCPATLARLIHGRQRGAARQKTLETLNRTFKSNPVLEPWRADWNEHYEMFNDAAESH